MPRRKGSKGIDRASGKSANQTWRIPMKLFKFTRKLVNEEDGAVTVDWVVLTAAVVGLGAAALLLIRQNTGTLSSNIASYLATATVKTTF